jgi:hypothetical protein
VYDLDYYIFLSSCGANRVAIEPLARRPPAHFFLSFLAFPGGVPPWPGGAAGGPVGVLGVELELVAVVVMVVVVVLVDGVLVLVALVGVERECEVEPWVAALDDVGGVDRLDGVEVDSLVPLLATA